MKSKPSWLLSTLGVAVVAALLYVTLEWHADVVQKNSSALATLQFSGRSLSTAGPVGDAPPITDDATRDETCRQYIVNFLNGTTDAKDECDGLYNAWKAADCKDDSHINFLQKKHKGADGNMTDDDVVIDDAYENWECCESISDYYEKNCQDTGFDAVRLLGIVSVLVVCGFLRSFLRMTGIQWVPDAGMYLYRVHC